MRIYLEKTNQSNINDIYFTIDEFDLNKYYSINNSDYFDNYQVLWLDSFTDFSRYLLNVYETRFISFYKQDFINSINIELTLNFNLEFDFKLFDEFFVNYWSNDEVFYIKPLIYSYGNLDLAILGFNPLTVSFLKNIYFLLGKKPFFCRKINNKILLSFYKYQEVNDHIINEVIDNFLNAIYEMVKQTSGRYSYEIPPINGQVQINMQEWYKKQQENNKKSKKSKKNKK